MQQNTWKYFSFPKIEFPENILWEPNTALEEAFCIFAKIVLLYFYFNGSYYF